MSVRPRNGPHGIGEIAAAEIAEVGCVLCRLDAASIAGMSELRCALS